MGEKRKAAAKKTPTKAAPPAPASSPVVDLAKYDPEELDVPIESLVFDPDNPKKHPKRNLDHLRALLAKYGQIERLVTQKETNVVIGGNGRLAIMKALVKAGDSRFKTVKIIALDVNNVERRVLSVALNRSPELGEWDNVKLAETLALAATQGVPESVTGFTSPEVERLVDRALSAAKEVKLDINTVADGEDPDADDIVSAAAAEADAAGVPMEDVKPNEEDGSLGGVLKLNPDVRFPSNLIFDYPELRRDMMAKCPEPILCWTGADKTGAAVHIDCEHYFLVYGTDHKPPNNDWTNIVVGFYIDDDKFDECWFSPDVFTAKMLKRKPYAMIAPNFSILPEMVTAEKIYSMFRSRWVARFWQEAGIKIIPDIITGLIQPPDYKYAWAGIPSDIPCVSIQLQTTKTDDEFKTNERRNTIRAMLDIVRPQSMIVYGDMAPKKRNEILDGLLPSKFPIIAVRDWTSRRLRPEHRTTKEKALEAASA
jgi:hypothetical protein